MGSESNTTTTKLTLNDPVGKETLDKLGELEGVRSEIGNQLLDIKNEEIKLLAAARKVDEERYRLFERCLMERGLAPNTPANINAQTGLITLIGPIEQPAKPPTAPATPPADTQGGSTG